MVRSRNEKKKGIKRKELTLEEKEDRKGIYYLFGLFLISFLSIVFGNYWFKIIGWVSLALEGLTAYHISVRYKENGKKEGINMANNAQVVGLMLALFIGGALIGFNLIETMAGIDLGLGFGDITGLVSGIWIIIARIVGIVLMGLSIFVIVNIIKG